MNPLHRLTQLLTLALGLSAVSSYGTFFSYDYTFGDGLVVSGTMDGTQNGNFVENISNVSVFFNGTAMPGTVFAATYDSADYLSGPVVSFDARQNNFLFMNSDLAAGDFGYDSIFAMFNASVYADTALAFSTLGFASQDWPTARDRWSLRVPDSSATIVFVGLTVMGLAWVRRKQSPADPAQNRGAV